MPAQDVIDSLSGRDDAIGSSIRAFLAAIGDFSFLYATGILFLASIIIVIVASLMTPPPSAEQVEGLTYESISADGKAEIDASWDKWNKILATTVIGLVLAMYLYFSFWLS